MRPPTSGWWTNIHMLLSYTGFSLLPQLKLQPRELFFLLLIRSFHNHTSFLLKVFPPFSLLARWKQKVFHLLLISLSHLLLLTFHFEEKSSNGKGVMEKFFPFTNNQHRWVEERRFSLFLPFNKVWEVVRKQLGKFFFSPVKFANF